MISIYNYKQRNVIIIAILLILSTVILYSVRGIAGALLSTVVLYTILRPIFLFLVYQWDWKRWIAALFIMLSSFVIIVLPFFALSMMVIHKVSDFQNNSLKIKVFIDQITSFIGSKLNQHDLLNKHHLLDKTLQRVDVFIAELFPSLLSGAVDIIFGLTIMYFLLYFMFVEQKEFEGGLLRHTPFGGQTTLRFANELKNTTYSNILGQGLIALVQGSLVGIGFWVFGIEDALFWGTISVFISLLPMIGAGVIFVPAAVIELIHGNSIAGWGLLIWGVVVITNIDNVIRLMIAKRISNTHPVITLIGVIAGIPMFGILGLVFGPLLFSYFILTIKIFETNMLASKRLEKIQASTRKTN